MMMEPNDKHAEIKEKLRSWQEHNLSIMFPLLISGKCSRVQTASEQTTVCTSFGYNTWVVL